MPSLKSPRQVVSELVQRLRARRLQRGWTQAELAERAGVKLATFIVFERTGKISLLRLLKVLEVLDLLDEFDALGRSEDFSRLSLDEIVQPRRQRGMRRKP